MNPPARTPSGRPKLIAGNWKMHGSLQASGALVAALREGVSASTAARMLLCPPYPYLKSVGDWARGSGILLGAQDISARVGSGAYTGEVAGAMLADVGCRYAIVGHSERRTLFGENDQAVAAKFDAAQQAALIPILCVGETLEEREAGRTDAVVERQMTVVLDSAGVGAFSKAVVAYEPVWAIGTGRTATPEQAQAVHAMIRALVAARDATIAASLIILYGGSVKASNAADLFAMGDIDGGLVGGASLEASEFLSIYRAATSQPTGA